MNQTINERQRRALIAVAEIGSGAKLNKRTARALERRGLIEVNAATVWDSGSGATARITDDGREIALAWCRSIAEERQARGLTGTYWTRLADRMARELQRAER